MPCVFAPYAGANILDAYGAGGSLNDVWQAPFFEAVRRWQREHDVRSPSRFPADNWLMPCPVRDHYPDFRSCVAAHRPEPEDEAAQAALADEQYEVAMTAYGRDLQQLTRELCDSVYGVATRARAG
jgi:hypothetical protein